MTLSPRGRLVASLALLVVAVYLSLSLRLVEKGRGQAVLDAPFPALRPRLLSPGWHVVPPGILRVTYYPEKVIKLPFHLPAPGRNRLVSSEGVGVEVEGSLAFRIPADSVLSLHASTSGSPERRFVGPMLDRVIVESVRDASFSRISGSHRFELEAELSRRLGPGLRKRGVTFLGVRVDAVRMAGGSLGGVSLAPLSGSRLLLVGLDGADWKVMDPLLERGKLPNLARLISGGVRARLKSIDPMLSPVIWTTIATGFLPPQHGVLDFMVTDVRNGEKVPVTSRQRKVKAIWNLLDEAGVPVGVIGWWASWPAEPVDGYVVSDRVAYQLMGQGRMGDNDPRGKCFPPDLFSRILPLVVPPETVSDAELTRFVRLEVAGEEAMPTRSESRLNEFRTVLASTRTYEGIAEALSSGGFQRFEAIYFEGIDTTSHLFMPFRPPRRPGISAADSARFSGAVDAFYAHQDEVLGRLLEVAPHDTNILVLSDHGFRSEADRPVGESRIGYATAALWHRRYGVLIASGPAFKKGATVSEASVLDITPTVLAVFGLPVGEDMQGRPIVDLFRPEFLSAHPIRYRPSWETGRAASIPTIADPVGDRAIREKLLSLGYLSQEGAYSRNNLGNSLLAQGDLEGAIREFRKAVEESPESAMSKINLARAYMATADFTSARKLLEDAIRITSDFPEAEILLANVERKEGKGAEAEVRLRKLLARGPSAEAHRNLGLLYYEKGQMERAEEEFRKSIDLEPEAAESYNNLGVALKEEGKLEEAEAQFRSAMEADPDYAGSYNNLALIAMDRQDWEMAGTLLQNALEKAPGDAMIHNNRGNLFFHQGKLPQAEEEYGTALALKVDYPEPHNGLGSILGKRGDRRGAIREYRKALEIQPRYLNARLNLAQALMLEGVTAEAVSVCREGVTLMPESTKLWNLLGEISQQAGDRKGAEEAYRNSLALDPAQDEIRQRLNSLQAGER